MNIEKYTQNAQQAVMDSQDIAVSAGHQMVDGEHIHLALLQQRDGLIPKLVRSMGVNADAVTRDVQAELDRIPKVTGGSDSLYGTRRFNNIFINAEKIAEQFGDEYVSVEHLYLSLLGETGTPSAKIFQKYGITREGFLEALSGVRGNQRITSQNPEDNYEALEKYGRDLVELARQGNVRLHLAGTAQRTLPEFFSLLEEEHVIYHGVTNERETLALLQNMDAAIVPHVQDDVSRYMDPMKMQMYAAVGLPVLCPEFLACTDTISYHDSNACLEKIKKLHSRLKHDQASIVQYNSDRTGEAYLNMISALRLSVSYKFSKKYDY